MALFRRPTAEAEPSPVGEPQGDTAVPAGSPSRMPRTEALYGYVVGLELVAVAILNLAVRGGKGAPAHPQTTFEVVALIVAGVFLGLVPTRNRLIVGVGAIIAAALVTTPSVPDSLRVIHLIGLVVPFVYGLIITQRQRKALLASGRGGRRRRAAGTGTSEPAARAGADARRGRNRDSRAKTPAGGPRPSARYTPPKPKRGQGRVSGRSPR